MADIDLSPPLSLTVSSGINSSASSVSSQSLTANTPPSKRPYNSYSLEEHLSTLRNVANDIFEDEDAILALPRRQTKSQRALAVQLSTSLWKDLTEIAAIIKYEKVTTYSKAVIRQRRADKNSAASLRNNLGGKLMIIQGPWAGQDLDPVDLKGPAAIPMPVTIGTADEFRPVFNFLAEDKTIAEATELQGIHGIELLWKTPLLEFDRGIVYEDGRLDLCKKVVGPTYIAKLMESLESNHKVSHFLLGNNAISTTGARCIAGFLEKYPDRMETWYLAGCHITRHGLSLLAPQMSKSTTITNLWFKRNPFGPNSSALLAELVLRTKNLRTLDLETTELGDAGTRLFIDGICGKPSSLRHLFLNANGIGQTSCASLAKYLADPHCALESLFLSTNPIGDAGMKLLAPGLIRNKTLQRLMLASTGLTSKGVNELGWAIVDSDMPLQAVHLGASPTTKTHSQKFNYIDDNCINGLKLLIQKPSMRWLGLGRTSVSAEGVQKIRSAVSKSELVYFEIYRVEVTTAKTEQGLTEAYEGLPANKSCSLELKTVLGKNQAKYYPRYKSYLDFRYSDDCRFLRNTSDVRKIDSMYRTMDKRLGLPMDADWEEGDPTWKLITEDAILAERG